jgi:hypothetical protein
MAEFRKMDSIAGHASSFRATPGRFQPVTMTRLAAVAAVGVDRLETLVAEREGDEF